MKAINSIQISLVLLLGLSLIGCGQPIYKADKQSPQRAKVIQTAKNMLGVKYRYGGSSPVRGFDCSGLVQYTHLAAGIRLPRTTGQQYRAVRRIQKRFLSPGDLVFFKTNRRSHVSHVGIYLGNYKFIHAPSSGKRVKINSMKENYWRKRFSGAGKVL